jgi:hypothetical protein
MPFKLPSGGDLARLPDSLRTVTSLLVPGYRCHQREEEISGPDYSEYPIPKSAGKAGHRKSLYRLSLPIQRC